MANAAATETAGAPFPFEPECAGFRLADGRVSPCLEWNAFTDPATLPMVEDLAGWVRRAAKGKEP